MAVLSVRNFAYAYGKKEVLRDVSFDVEAGDVAVLIGPNGAGKSTLIKSVARILKAPQDSILLDGRRLSDYSPNAYARKVAYVPQTPTYDASLVLDAVVLGRLPLFSAPSTADYDAAWQAIERVGIAHLASENVLHLSGGERQKVALARALCAEPQLVLLDEPTANLDMRSQYSVLHAIRSLAADGVSFLMSIHDINQAMAAGNRFVVLRDNTAVACGDEQVLTEELLAQTFGLHFEKIYHGHEIHFHIKEEN